MSDNNTPESETEAILADPEALEAIAEAEAEIAYAPGEPFDVYSPDPVDTFVPTPESYEALEVVALRKDVQEANQRKVQLFERLGVNIAPALLGCRLETLIEWAVGGEDTQQRKDFDAEFEQKLSPLLDQIADQVKVEMARRDAEAGAKLIQSDGRPLRSV